ncbi:MAG TPA: hypothetical protein VGZ47_15065 [Gemmataceae bacterium]|nr:hypothetical protein [Gemmataceae bacterium]
MTNQEWIALLRQLPPDLHNKLILILQNRTQIVIDAIYRLEPSFALIRGRIGGTIEGGLLVMAPYDQISAIYAAKEVPEDSVIAIFDGRPAAPAEAKSKPGGSHHPTPPESPSTPPSPTPAGDPAALRNNLLERLRAARQGAR